MNLNHDDRQRVWKALASYIDECKLLAERSDEPELTEFYQVEIAEAHDLRSRLNGRES